MEELLHHREEKSRSSSNRYELWKLPGVNPDGPKGGAHEEDWSEILPYKRGCIYTRIHGVMSQKAII
jgi:hypothetical protein